MGYSIEPVMTDCYPGTTVLINRFDIRDEDKLSEVETVLVSARNAEWLTEPRETTFDFVHYKALHRFLFSDLYAWAGQTRTVNIAKLGTQFCPADEIESSASRVFTRLARRKHLTNLVYEDFVDGLVDFYISTNYLHPFREGNGRTQRAFISQLAENAGYEAAWDRVDPDLLMIATIQASSGVADTLHGVFEEIIIPL